MSYREDGIHFGCLLPWAQLNSWNYFRHPWLQGERMEEIFRSYVRLRYRLIPYLYSMAREAHETGMPMMRPMPLMWPREEAARECLHQFLLGDSLLVGCFTDEVWLPEGTWFNFWTDERIQGGGTVSPEVPDGRGGPLLAPAGAILPMGPAIDYVGQRALDELTVHVYAGAAGEITLYEDDGRSFDFEGGAFRTQRIHTEPVGDGLGMHFDDPEGSYDGAVERRETSVIVHGLPEAASVVVDGQPIARSAYGPRPRWHTEDGRLVVSLGMRGVEHLGVVIE
jgi:alpha-glucosidase (family GH31 glycosyl hydrolase)